MDLDLIKLPPFHPSPPFPRCPWCLDRLPGKKPNELLISFYAHLPCPWRPARKEPKVSVLVDLPAPAATGGTRYNVASNIDLIRRVGGDALPWSVRKPISEKQPVDNVDLL